LNHLLRSVVALGILAVPAVAGAQVTGGVRVRLNVPDRVFASTHATELAVFTTVPLNDVLAFQPEGLVRLQDTTFDEQRRTDKRTFDYCQIPLLGRFRFVKGSPVAILGGPSFGFSTRVREFAETVNIDVKGFDVGYVAGVGVEVDHVVLDWRYTWGLASIAKNGAPETSDNGSAKHRVLSLSAGWRF
jgi:hypothetical protein